MRARDLANALYRGGNDVSEKQLVQRVRDTFKSWKEVDRVQRDAETPTWKSTPKGKADLAEPSSASSLLRDLFSPSTGEFRLPRRTAFYSAPAA